MAYRTMNPATGEVVAEYPTISQEDLDAAIGRADAAFRSWRTRPLGERTAVLARTAEIYRERKDELAAILTLEMGKPITQAKGEVELVASIFQYYAENAAKFLADETLEIAGGGEAVVRTEPLGVLLGIMPWNFPYYQVARFAAPNLALGNTILLKHASNCPRAALAMEDVFREAGLPDGAFVNVFAETSQVEGIIADRRVAGVSLTGSERAGAAVGRAAGEHLKKAVLELGGSDPFIVLDDADLDAAVPAAVNGRLFNAGQACTAAKRFIVVESVYDDFVKRFSAAMAEVTPGDPSHPDTFLGSLSSPGAVDDLDELVDDAVSKGATLATERRPRTEAGAFYSPVVLTDVTPEMRAFDEELFGPVAVVYKVRDDAAAIALANGSPYGLSATVFSSDEGRAREVGEQLESGMVWINAPGRSAPDLPFGGVKRSGFGRELARFGMDEFANKKLVRIP